MISHYHGQLLNLSELARSFGVSDHSVHRYLEIPAGTYMIRLFPPWHANVGEHLVKAPKLYRSLRSAPEHLAPEHVWILYPGTQEYTLHGRVTVLPLTGLAGLQSKGLPATR